MIMRKIYLLILSLALCAGAFAQQRTAEEFLQRYNTVSSRLGADGVGIETLITEWEAAYPEDINMLQAKWAYYYTKAATTTIVAMDQEKYLGEPPVLTLKDSLDRDVNYFQKIVFDDEMFGTATQAMDQAIKLDPLNLELRLAKLTALLTYEGDSPDLTSQGLKSLIDYHYHSHPAWVFSGDPVTQEEFEESVQQYCYDFYRIGTPTSFEAFREAAQKMIDYKSKNVVFQNDVATYYQTYKDNPKEALKRYAKVLKAVPDDYTAIKNSVLIARKTNDKKNEKKYLALLAKYAPTENERLSAQARLSVLK